MPTQFAQSGREIAQGLMAEGSPIDEFSPKELAALTGTRVDYWAELRFQGRGPRFFKEGYRGIRYRRLDIVRWFVKRAQEEGVPKV